MNSTSDSFISLQTPLNLSYSACSGCLASRHAVPQRQHSRAPITAPWCWLAGAPAASQTGLRPVMARGIPPWVRRVTAPPPPASPRAGGGGEGGLRGGCGDFPQGCPGLGQGPGHAYRKWPWLVMLLRLLLQPAFAGGLQGNGHLELLSDSDLAGSAGALVGSTLGRTVQLPVVPDTSCPRCLNFFYQAIR